MKEKLPQKEEQDRLRQDAVSDFMRRNQLDNPIASAVDDYYSTQNSRLAEARKRSKEQQEQERLDRSNTHKEVDRILQKPALPSMLEDESLPLRKAARDQARAELDAIVPPQHPFDAKFDVLGGSIGGGEKMVDLYVRDPITGERTKKLLTRKQYETQFPESMRDYEKDKREYVAKRKAAQDNLDKENRSIVDWNEKAASDISPAERTKQWAEYNQAAEAEKEKLRKKTEREEKRAVKRAEYEAIKQQAGMFAATAQVLRMPIPSNPMALGNFRDKIATRLKASFGTYGASDPKTLRQFGLNEDAIKFMFSPFNEDQNNALSEIITKRLYEGDGAGNPSARTTYGLLKAVPIVTGKQIGRAHV